MTSQLLENKWQETKGALMDGVEGTKAKNLDVVLENTRKYLSEQATSGATGSGNVATLNRVILPTDDPGFPFLERKSQDTTP